MTDTLNSKEDSSLLANSPLCIYHYMRLHVPMLGLHVGRITEGEICDGLIMQFYTNLHNHMLKVTANSIA